jgi:hypothetical protein
MELFNQHSLHFFIFARDILHIRLQTELKAL